MNCPCCPNKLVEIVAGKVILEGCTVGCGGLWFDHNELEKLDESSDHVPANVLGLLQSATVAVDRAKQRFCPKCAATPLDRHYYDGNYHLEIDNCGSCGGIWLDLGELPAIRDQNDLRNTALKTQGDFVTTLEQSNDPSLAKRARAIFQLLFR